MLTAGQQVIREVIYQELPYYHKLVPRSGDGYAGLKEESFYERIKARLANHDVIRHDSITSARLGYEHVSPNYLTWCYHLSKKTTVLPEVISFDRCVYRRSNASGEAPIQTVPGHQGGRKYQTTIEVLFGFAEGRKISYCEFDCKYYISSRILFASTGGNHRLLACALWGNQAYVRGKVACHQEYYPDETLFKALLCIDKLFPSPLPGQSIFSFSRYLHGLNREELETVLLPEANQAKEFYAASKEEQQIIRDYAGEYFKPDLATPLPYAVPRMVYGTFRERLSTTQTDFQVDSRKQQECRFEWLTAHLKALRAMRSQPKLSFLAQCTQAWRGRTKLTPFERWYQLRQDKND